MPYSQIRNALARLILLCALCFGVAGIAVAHPANVAGGRAKIKADGTFTMEARFDLLAYLAGATPVKVADAPMNALLDGPPENLQKALKIAEAKFARETALKADNGAGVIDSIQFPTLAQVQDWRDNGLPPRLPVMLVARLGGHFPAGARTVSFAVPPLLGTFVFSAEVENQEPFTQALENGAFSTPFLLLTGLPQPTPQAPGESPAALFKPKKQASAKAAPKSASKVASKVAPAKSKKSAPAKSAAVRTAATPQAKPPADKQKRQSDVAAVALPNSPAPGAPRQARVAMEPAPGNASKGAAKAPTRPAQAAPATAMGASGARNRRRPPRLSRQKTLAAGASRRIK